MKRLLIKTNFGDVTAELYSEQSPITVNNILHYVDNKFYDDTIFHRFIKNFVLQAGGFNTAFEEKSPLAPGITNESSNMLSNKKYTLSMARTGNPNSGTSHFFINLADNTFLDYKDGQEGYAVFGEITDGVKIIDNISNTIYGTLKHGYQDCPNEDILIHTMIVL